MAEAPIVQIRALRKSFGTNEVLKGIDLSVARGEVVALIGRGGSGKSTLLRCGAGLVKGRWVKGRAKAEGEARARALLERVGLANKFDAWPDQLSGGQQQRVAIARALAMRPRVLLFDEPTSALDPELVGEVLDVVTDLARAGKTMIVVTHEIAFAREAASRVVFMEAGRILEQGPARETLANPRTERLRSFLARVL